MLIKLYLDETFPLELPSGPTMCMWLVLDALPLSHEKQAVALLKAAKLAASSIEELDLTALYFLQQGGVYIEDSNTKSIKELGIKAGAMLRLTSVPPQKPSRMIGQAGSSSPASRNMSRFSVTQEQQDEADEQDLDGATMMNFSNRGQATATPRPDDDGGKEAYNAGPEEGWFPFTLGSNKDGESAIVIPNPQIEPKETDLHPNTLPLCHTCEMEIQAADSMSVRVDRHYKPVVMETTVAEGKVEKVGGARIPRWQSRWLTIDEKSLNWYETEPKPGTRDVLKGTRAMRDGAGGKLMLVDVTETPDPTKHPKVKDKPELFHFGVTFISSSGAQVALVFRVPTAKERTNFVDFLKGIVKRYENRGANKDPVHWKKAANTLLSSLTRVGELSGANDQEEEALTEEIKILEAEVQELREEKPIVQGQMSEETAKLKTQQTEIDSLNQLLQDVQKVAVEAEARVQEAMEDYELAHLEINEEMKLKKMLEKRAANRREVVQAELDALQEEVETLEGFQHQLFSQCRKGEENHGQEQRASTGTGDRHFSFAINAAQSALTPVKRSTSMSSMSPQAGGGVQVWGSPMGKNNMPYVLKRSNSVLSSGSN